MATKKGDRDSRGGKAGRRKAGRKPTEPKRSGGDPQLVASRSTVFQGNLPAIVLRSPLVGPEPAPGEELMFDLGQLIGSGPQGSLNELNAELVRLTSGGPIPRSQPTEPRAKAQRLMYDAWQGSREAGLPLAKRALALDPDCADAHLFLALASRELNEVLKHVFEAVDAGERTVAREEKEGLDEANLWAYLPARPYLRARAFLATYLWTMGGRVAAVAVLQESLDLDEGDALGLRYLLLGWCLDMGEEMFTRELLERYKQEHSAIFLYGNALLTFWERGEERTTNARLKRALAANPHVPERLVFCPPDPLKVLAINSYRPGGEEEADICAILLGPAWERDIEAMEWLQEAVEKSSS